MHISASSHDVVVLVDAPGSSYGPSELAEATISAGPKFSSLYHYQQSPELETQDSLLMVHYDNPSAAFSAINELNSELVTLGADNITIAPYVEIARLRNREKADEWRADEHLLTVRLPVPIDREAEWNVWYRDTHMPSVLQQLAGDVEHGYRYAPLGSLASDYFVAYAFRSATTLDRWMFSEAVSDRADDYYAKWRVRNLRRAFHLRQDASHVK